MLQPPTMPPRMFGLYMLLIQLRAAIVVIVWIVVSANAKGHMGTKHPFWF